MDWIKTTSSGSQNLAKWGRRNSISSSLTVKKAYELLGIPARASLAVHPGEHEFHQGLCQEWFDQWL
jgi:hypothetical protein